MASIPEGGGGGVMRPPLKAIRVQCLGCVCGSHKAVKECACTDCSMYPFRFGKRPPKSDLPHRGDGGIEVATPRQAIRNYCLWCMGWRGCEGKRTASRWAKECHIEACPIWHLRPGQKTCQKPKNGQLQRTYSDKGGSGRVRYLKGPRASESGPYEGSEGSL